MADVKFYQCNSCKNMSYMVKDSGVNPVCCGEKMQLLDPSVSDGAAEKHVPVAEVVDGKVEVNVGEVNHPMTEAHYIEWIALASDGRVDFKFLTPEDKPAAKFKICPNCACERTVFAFCNLHGLYSTQV